MSDGTPITPPGRAWEETTPHHAGDAWIWPASTTPGDRMMLKELTKQMRQLGCPTLARARDLEERPDGTVRLTWDTPVGVELAEIRSAQRLSEPAVLKAALALVDNLARARSANACVGSWDPAQLVVSETPTLRLTIQDPGVRGLPTNLRPRPSTVSEASATAPERATGGASGPSSIAAESYAMGATLVYALTGSPALSATSAQGYLRAQLSGDPPMLTALDSHLAEHTVLAKFIADCLQRAPASRPQNYDELRRRLEQAVLEAETLKESRAFLPARVSDTVEMRRPRTSQNAILPEEARWRAYLVPIGVLMLLVTTFAILVLSHPGTRMGPPERPPPAAIEQVPTSP